VDIREFGKLGIIYGSEEAQESKNVDKE